MGTQILVFFLTYDLCSTFIKLAFSLNLQRYHTLSWFRPFAILLTLYFHLILLRLNWKCPLTAQVPFHPFNSYAYLRIERSIKVTHSDTTVLFQAQEYKQHYILPKEESRTSSYKQAIGSSVWFLPFSLTVLALSH